MSPRARSLIAASSPRWILPLAALFVSIIIPAEARAGLALGDASKYNVFVFDDFYQSNSNAGGKVAVGGNANFTGGFSVATQIPGSNPVDDRVVTGGNLNWTGGATVFNNGVGNGLGNIRTGGTASIGGGVGYNQKNTGNLPFSFNAVEGLLKGNSAFWGNLAANGIVSSTPWGALKLSGTNPTLNVFNLDGPTQMSGLSTLTFEGIPAGATVLVNVLGNPGDLKDFSFDLGGADVSKILFNFVNATSLSVQNVSFMGSILAPYAAMTFHNGQINGNVIVNSLGTQSGRSNGSFNAMDGTKSLLFVGDLPDPSPTAAPEPGSLALAGVGGALLVFWRRKQSRSRMRASS